MQNRPGHRIEIGPNKDSVRVNDRVMVAHGAVHGGRFGKVRSWTDSRLITVEFAEGVPWLEESYEAIDLIIPPAA